MIRKLLSFFSYRPHYNGSKDDPQGTFVPQSTNMAQLEGYTFFSARICPFIRAGCVPSFRSGEWRGTTAERACSVLTSGTSSGNMTESEPQLHTRRSGGTGRHAAFRAQWAYRPWGFESPLRHQVYKNRLTKRFFHALKPARNPVGSPQPSKCRTTRRKNCRSILLLAGSPLSMRNKGKRNQPIEPYLVYCW